MRIASSLIFGLTTLYVILFAASVAILFALVWLVTSRSMLAQIEANVQREAISLADEYRAAGAAAAAASIERRLQRGGLAYYLLQRRNAWLAGNIAPVPPVVGALDLQVRLQRVPGDQTQADLRDAIGYGVLLSDGTYVLAGEDVGRLQTARRAILTAFAVGGGTSLILAILGGLLLSSRFLRRVESVNRTARQIMAGQLDSRVPVRSNGDELDRLAANLNAMLDRIQLLMESLKQVSSDIAHDLRTPLARLRQGLETARATAQTVDEFRASTDAAIAETEGLLETFSALLRIAQIESGSRRARFATVDLSEIFLFVATTFTAVAEDQGQRLVSDIEGRATISGDRELLLQLATNLVENAIRHTPKGTTIEVKVRRNAEEVVAIVSDDGRGIPAEERAKVFRRFYRLEASRTTPPDCRKHRRASHSRIALRTEVCAIVETLKIAIVPPRYLIMVEGISRMIAGKAIRVATLMMSTNTNQPQPLKMSAMLTPLATPFST
jgi:signal transduction histidine kinase